MNRVEIKNKIEQNVFSILKDLKHQNLVNFKNLQNYKVTEIYQTTDVVGILAFEFEDIEDLKAEVAIKILNLKAMSIIKEKYSNLIYFITFLSKPNDLNIYKIRVCLNYSEINDYINSLENICFKTIGFKNINYFLSIFGKYGLKEIVNHDIPSLQSYRFNRDVTQVKFGFKNSLFEDKMRNLKMVINKNSDSVESTTDIGQTDYLFKINNRKVLIKFKKEQDVSLVIFEKVVVKINKIEGKPTTVIEDLTSDKTHKFV